MIIRNRALAAVAVVGAVALTASACGGSKGTGSSSDAAGKSSFNAAVTSIVNPSAKKGGTLQFWANQDVDSLDPTRAYYAFAWDLQRLYARTLLTYPSQPGTAGLQLSPDLASAMPTISNGGKTYTFKLRTGLKFSDGAPLTSKDVKYGIERDFAQDVLPGGPVYLQQILDQGQKYPGPYKDTDPNKMGLKSVQTPDPQTIVFNLASPNSDFEYYLAMGASTPVEAAKDTGANYQKAPLATGPYMIQSYTPNQAIKFVRNPNWDPSTDPIRKALPDAIDVTITTNADDLDSRLLAGTADLDIGQVGVQTAAQAKILTNPQLKANTDDAPNGFIRYIAMDTKVAPFNNVHCRKAVEYAANPTDLQTARGGPTAGAIATNMLPPNILGHDSYDPYNLAAGKAQVDKAKQELALCGQPNGFSTTIAARNNKPKEVKTAEALQASLKAVGINLTIDQYDGAQSSSVIGAPSVVHKKGYGLMVFGWGADYPTASGFLSMLVDGRQILADGNNNLSEINDPQINSLIDKAAAETDPKAAAADYTQINHMVMDQALYVPVVYDQALNYRNPRLTNVVFLQALGMIDFAALGTSDGK
ncbi:ABC transporter substrate-binding protein [Streptacidiphilus neutrinimicus]|uniref:ABC transporter substrate-binding protein n=1 Tax=Streptacidiphilus neutrinimicus TaxID=105420 RepID=UPI0005AB5073|nr:ABC transporter substrate-binding protein [Streptacidiphilus neutrinimicus]